MCVRSCFSCCEVMSDSKAVFKFISESGNFCLCSFDIHIISIENHFRSSNVDIRTKTHALYHNFNYLLRSVTPL